MARLQALDLSSSPQHLCKNTIMVYVLLIPALGRQTQEDPRGSLTTQNSLAVKFRTVRDPVPAAVCSRPMALGHSWASLGLPFLVPELISRTQTHSWLFPSQSSWPQPEPAQLLLPLPHVWKSASCFHLWFHCCCKSSNKAAKGSQLDIPGLVESFKAGPRSISVDLGL